MPSKICKKCGRTVNTGGCEPRFCPWGCGALDEEPGTIIEQPKQPPKVEVPKEPPKIRKDGQTLLFEVESYTQDTFF